MESLASRSAVRICLFSIGVGDGTTAGGAAKMPLPAIGATVRRVSIGTTTGKRRTRPSLTRFAMADCSLRVRFRLHQRKLGSELPLRADTRTCQSEYHER